MHHRSSTVDYRTLPPRLGSALRGEVYELHRRTDSRALPPTVCLRRLSAAGVPLSAGAAIVPLSVAPIAGGMPIAPGSGDRAATTKAGGGAAAASGGRAGSASGGGGRARGAGSGRGGTDGRGGSPDDPAGGAFRIGTGRAGLDHALRVDLLVATLGGMRSRGLLDSPTPIGIMIKRSGALETTEDDLGWLRAWPIACDIGGCTRGPVWAVTRHGWIDVGENSVVELPRHWLRRPPPGHTGPS
jgi:hypothetical protein